MTEDGRWFTVEVIRLVRDICPAHSRVAQLVEQPAVNRRVAGSSPASGARYSRCRIKALRVRNVLACLLSFSYRGGVRARRATRRALRRTRSEEHTSELQSQSNLVCRLLLEKKKRVCRSCHR